MPRTVRIFIADLHLNGVDSSAATTFRAVLQRLSAEATQGTAELYILGDLFNFWEEYHSQVAAMYEKDISALREAAKSGVHIGIIDGNRDFCYGKFFHEDVGATLLHDGHKVVLSDSRPVWIEHGDLLCTRDTRYLRYRRWVRSRSFRAAYSMLPWAIARKVIARMEKTSKADQATKRAEAFQVDAQAALARLNATGCRLLLCGHTHQPQAVDLGGGKRLLVLPAWCEVAGGYVDSAAALRPMRFTPDGEAHPVASETDWGMPGVGEGTAGGRP